jgi:hypothetical protein
MVKLARVKTRRREDYPAIRHKSGFAMAKLGGSGLSSPTVPGYLVVALSGLVSAFL